MAYQPCPVWMLGEEYVVNMCDDALQYQPGAFKKLLNFHENNNVRHISPEKLCILICDEAWMGNIGYLNNNTLKNVVSDIESEGFTVNLIQL